MNIAHSEMEADGIPLFKKILLFSLPIMAMNILQLLFNAADMIVVGQFSGREALAAVGATNSLIQLLLNLFLGLSAGTSVVVAQEYGARDYASVNRTVQTSIAISVIGGLLVMGTGVLFCEQLLIMMGTPEDIIGLSTLYMKIYFIGVPASMVYNFAAAVLRATGDSKHPMYYLVLSGILNVILNVFFVVALGMSVDGVAWATVISQYLSVVLIMSCLARCDRGICFTFRNMAIDVQKLKRIVKIGIPAGLQGTLFSISNVLVQSAVNSFGSTMVAASSAASNIEGLVGTTMNAYYNSAITFTGQSMGAKQYKRIDSVAKICTVLIFASWFILCGSILIFGKKLIGIYNSDPEVIELGYLRMQVMMSVNFFCAIMNVFPGLSRGMGYSILPMLCTLIGVCLTRIVWLSTVFTWYPTVLMLFLCYPATWFLTSMGQIASFFYARRQVHKRCMNETSLLAEAIPNEELKEESFSVTPQ
ncbi:MAG: MATE family efflux transporter [Eubacteriales bacterium]|nr:MATE family efflux transporter [Eubacteriales bacterium]